MFIHRVHENEAGSKIRLALACARSVVNILAVLAAPNAMKYTLLV